MLFIILFNTGWGVAAAAERLGLRLRKSGHYGGYVTLDDWIDLNDMGYRTKVVD